MSYYQKYVELLEQGANIPHNSPEIEEWRAKVRELGKKADEEHAKWVNKIESQWLPGEWDKIEETLNKLTLPEITELAHNVNIKFNVDNESVLKKRDYILVLDEANKKRLYLELKKLGYNLR